MHKITFLLFISALLLLSTGCSTNRFNAYRKLEGYKLRTRFETDFVVDKAVSDSRANVVFAMNKARQEVRIFRNTKQINSIGGLGFERTNFQRLTDIGVDTDGSLLALDSSQKLLRKFSPEGKIIAEMQFNDLRQPELFCVGGDGTLFVYDAATSEIVCFSPLDSTELYRFGRFELEQPLNLACNRDYLFAYSEAKGCTYVFYLLGQYKETIFQQTAYDAFNNPVYAYKIMPGYMSVLPKLFNINQDIVTITFDSPQIMLYDIIYSRNGDATQ